MELINDLKDSFCLIIAPKRGNSMENFLNFAKEKFIIEFLSFDQTIIDKFEICEKNNEFFNKDEHFLNIIKLYKK